MAHPSVRWLDVASRVVIVDTNFYDPNLDIYLQAVFVFELPLSNAVTRTAIVRPLVLGFDQTPTQQSMVSLEYARIACAVLLLLFTVRHELNSKIRRGHAPWRYPLTYGLLDAAILA